MALTIYHNPRCSKSRQTLALLEENGQVPIIRRYFDRPVHLEELQDLLKQLGFDDPRKLMRKGERIYKSLQLKEVSDNNKLIAAMLAHPQLIERPIVSDGQQAILGRPPENVSVFFTE